MSKPFQKQTRTSTPYEYGSAQAKSGGEIRQAIGLTDNRSEGPDPGYRICSRWGQKESMKVMLESRDAPDGSNYWSLTVGRIYEVLGIEGDDYRLLDDCDEPYLFDPQCFKVIDPAEPSHWISSVDDGVRKAYPPKWVERGFFQDRHERVIDVRQEFRRGLVKWCPETAAERGIVSI